MPAGSRLYRTVSEESRAELFETMRVLVAEDALVTKQASHDVVNTIIRETEKRCNALSRCAARHTVLCTLRRRTDPNDAVSRRIPPLDIRIGTACDAESVAMWYLSACPCAVTKAKKAAKAVQENRQSDVQDNGTFTCMKCRGARRPASRTTYYQLQTRGADEPMTVFVLCHECGNEWRT